MGRRTRLRIRNPGPRPRFKICGQCQEYTNNFLPNIYTEDGLSICCEACNTRAAAAFVANKPFPATVATKQAFQEFREYQRQLRCRSKFTSITS